MTRRAKQPPTETGGWAIEKRLRLEFIVGIVFQTTAAAWWASGVTATQATHNQEIIALKASQSALATTIAANQGLTGDRLGKLEVGQNVGHEILRRVEADLKQLSDAYLHRKR